MTKIITCAYPLEWPEGWARTEERARKSSSPFMTTFAKARKELSEELERLKATNAVMTSWLPARQDGEPFQDAARRKLEDPGVAVYFLREGRQVVMARDAYWSVHDNLRSIGLAIEHLRGLERHGGGAMMERAFEGFLALPAPERKKPARLWPEVLQVAPDAEDWMIEAAFRHHSKTRHPDGGGTIDAFNELAAAREEGLKVFKERAQ
jgi:hypothetical protein